LTKAVNPTFRRPKGLLIDLDGTVLPKSNQPSNAVKAAITAASKINPGCHRLRAGSGRCLPLRPTVWSNDIADCRQWGNFD
jgi:hypothetical protein